MEAQACARYKKSVPKPALACLACVDGVDADGDLQRTYYCSARCHSLDKKNHASICKDTNIRKKLFRAGKLLQTIFYQLREAAFDIKIKKIEERDGRILIFEDYYKKGQPTLFRFPQWTITDPKAKTAVLSYLACTDACDFLYDLSKELLTDLSSIIEETFFSVRPEDCLILRYFANGMQDMTRYSHTALTVEATDGESYVVDISGAQLGQHRPVITLDEFMDTHAQKVSEVRAHGKTAALAKEIREGARNIGLLPQLAQTGTPGYQDYGVHMLQHQIHKHFLAAVKEWELENKMSVRELLNLDQKCYKLSSESLLLETDSTFKAFIAEWEASGRKVELRVQQPSARPDWSEEPPILGEIYRGSNSKAYKRLLSDQRGCGTTLNG